MGQLLYGAQGLFEFEDRALVHLRSVIIAKLIRQQSFVFTWGDAAHQRSIWMHPAMHLEFHFEHLVDYELNRSWIESLAELANTPGGLRLIPEPE